MYPRSEWPSSNGVAQPPEVDGWELVTGCFRDWETHLHEVVPEVAVYDLTRKIRELQEELNAGVVRARAAGV
jgi:hypothetical protein